MNERQQEATTLNCHVCDMTYTWLIPGIAEYTADKFEADWCFFSRVASAWASTRNLRGFAGRPANIDSRADCGSSWVTHGFCSLLSCLGFLSVHRQDVALQATAALVYDWIRRAQFDGGEALEIRLQD